MKNIVDSVRMQIYERLSSPLFGSLVISWACWNYRFLFVLFSSLPVEKRFEFIDSNIFTSGCEILNDCIIKPVLSAILFILLYPRISIFFYRDWLQKQVETKELRDKIEKATLLTREESDAIRMKLVNVRNEYEERIQNQADEIVSLKAQQGQIPAVMVQPQKVDNKPSMAEGTLKLLKLLAEKNGGPLFKLNLHAEFPGTNKTRFDYYVDEGKKFNLMTEGTRTSMNDVLTITDRGRQLAVEKGYV